VVTWFEYELHRVGPVVTGGLIVHPFGAAGDVLRFYREASAHLPDEVAVSFGLVHASDGSGTPLCSLVVGHFGAPEDAERALAPFTSFGSPLDVHVGPIPYTRINAMIDATFPKGALNYWRAAFLDSLSDGAIDAMLTQFAVCPSPLSMMVLEHLHGAVCRIPVEATAFPHREPGYNLVISNVWLDPQATERCVDWAKATAATIEPFLAPRQYVNYLADDEGGDIALKQAFGPNLARLRDVKTTYDPDNLFRLNQNIPPG
jgi:hypothetical protein